MDLRIFSLDSAGYGEAKHDSGTLHCSARALFLNIYVDMVFFCIT